MSKKRRVRKGRGKLKSIADPSSIGYPWVIERGSVGMPTAQREPGPTARPATKRPAADTDIGPAPPEPR